MSAIIDIINDVVTKVSSKLLGELQLVNPSIQSVNYDHGHYVEISTTLAQKEGSPTLFGKKYPLIALFEDIRETVGNGINECNLTIIICFSTKAEYKSQSRYDNVINPILEPIYQEFMRQLKSHPRLIGYDVPHRKVNRPYWGIEGKMGNRANIFGDILDAIEVSNLKLKYKTKQC